MSSEKSKQKSKKGLGMGLSALLGDIDTDKVFSSEQNHALFEQNLDENAPERYTIINIDQIHQNPSQPRKVFLENELLELSDSIHKNGLLQPIIVRYLDKERGFQIVAGERRFRASKLAGLKELPCIVRDISDDQIFLIAIIENIQREDLNPLEEAESYIKLTQDFNYTQDEISKIIHKSRSHVANLIRLTKLPEEVKKMVREGKLTSGHVRPLLGLKTEEQMISVADVIAENNYSARKVEELVNLILNDEEKLEISETTAKISARVKAFKEPSKNALHLIDKFTEKFQSSIDIKPSKNGGTITIKYKTEQELEDIIDAISTEEIEMPNDNDFLTSKVI